jgi:shikimate kinase
VKEKSNIALIGFRASGKSLVGRLLARELNLSFVDMDERLVATFGRSIDQWVRSEGWEPFRKAESELLEQLAQGRGLVVATGGGVILNTHNRLLLKEHFLVIWLKASPETTYRRMLSDPNTQASRPAFTALPLQDEIQHIMTERAALYSETAHLILETEDALPAQLVSTIQCRISPDKARQGQNSSSSPGSGRMT